MMYRFMFRRGSAQSWADANPVLREGEPGVELDTRRYKLGDGVTPWVDLPHYTTRAEVDSAIQEALAGASDASLPAHIVDTTPHPAYDDLPSLVLLLENGLT